MSEARILAKNECLCVSGDLTFQTVTAVWRQSIPLLVKSPILQFDFEGVKVVNSAALALLLEWLKYAKKQQKKIVWRNVPEKLLSIAAVVGLKELFVLA